MYHTILAQSTMSGIPDALEQTYPPIVDYIGFFVLIIIGLVAFFGVFALVESYSNSNGLGFFLGFIVTLGILIAGTHFGKHTLSENRAPIYNATMQNVEENFDIHDVSLRNIDSYSDRNKTRVEGSHNGKFVEFEIAYSAEHDMMLPVNDSPDIPIKEGSALTEIMDEDTTEDEDKS